MKKLDEVYLDKKDNGHADVVVMFRGVRTVIWCTEHLTAEMERTLTGEWPTIEEWAQKEHKDGA